MIKSCFILLSLMFLSLYASAQFNYDSIRKSILSKSSSQERIEALHNTLETFESAPQDTVITYANWGMRMSQNANDQKSELDFLGIRAIQYIRSAEYSTALKDLFKALRISQKIEDSAVIANTLNNIGNVYRSTNKLENAENYYSRALKIQRAIGDSTGISFSYNNLGIIHMMRADYDTGMELWGKSLEMKLAVGDSSAAAVTMGNMAMYYRDIGETKKALDFLSRAEAIELARGDYHGLALNYSNVGELYVKEKNFDKALEFYNRSIECAEKAKSDEAISETYGKLVLMYESMGDFGLALEYHRKQVEIQNDILDASTQKDLLVLESQYIAQQQADKLELLRAEDRAKEETIARQNSYTWGLVIGLGLMLILAIVLIRGYVRKQRSNRLISEQKEQVLKQHDILEEKNKEIIDSITYAKRLQTAILPSKTEFEAELNSSFLMYLPKDIVAGDFYWLQRVGDMLFFAVADCTGHGVPGAMVSVVCSNALNRSVNEFALTDPGRILDKAAEIVKTSFQLENEKVNDGMDIALCAWNTTNRMLEFAGAHNSLYVVSDGELKEIKSDRQPVGAFEYAAPFTTTKVGVKDGDMLYLFSDGYPDQFGGPKGKKFKSSALKRMFLELSDKSLSTQKQHFLSTFESWKGDLEQIDDVCLLGVRI